MNEFEYNLLRSGGYSDFFDKLKGLNFDEYFSRIIPVMVYQKDLFELFITKIEKQKFGIVKPYYELFYRENKTGPLIKDLLKKGHKEDVCWNEPNLMTLVSGILNNHNKLGLIMSLGIQRNNDLFQKEIVS